MFSHYLTSSARDSDSEAIRGAYSAFESPQKPDATRSVGAGTVYSMRIGF